MHFYGLQNRNNHSLPLLTLEEPGHFNSDCIRLKEECHMYLWLEGE